MLLSPRPPAGSEADMVSTNVLIRWIAVVFCAFGAAGFVLCWKLTSRFAQRGKNSN